MQTRTLRVLTGGDDGESMLADGMGDPNCDSDLGRIVYAFRQWRGEPTPTWWNEAQHGKWEYRDRNRTPSAGSSPGFTTP